MYLLHIAVNLLFLKYYKLADTLPLCPLNTNLLYPQIAGMIIIGL